MAGVGVEPLRGGQPQKAFTEDDLHVRHFMRAQSKRLIRKGQDPAAKLPSCNQESRSCKDSQATTPSVSAVAARNELAVTLKEQTST